jgi:hypothetical protein
MSYKHEREEIYTDFVMRIKGNEILPEHEKARLCLNVLENIGLVERIDRDGIAHGIARLNLCNSIKILSCDHPAYTVIIEREDVSRWINHIYEPNDGFKYQQRQLNKSDELEIHLTLYEYRLTMVGKHLSYVLAPPQ